MEPKSSLLWSQDPSTGPYPKPAQSSPVHFGRLSKESVQAWGLV
jgi:hypothetical protein